MIEQTEILSTAALTELKDVFCDLLRFTNSVSDADLIKVLINYSAMRRISVPRERILKYLKALEASTQDSFIRSESEKLISKLTKGEI